MRFMIFGFIFALTTATVVFFVQNKNKQSVKKEISVHANPVVPTVALGKKLFSERACLGCHSINGKRMVGPTFKDLFGSERKLADGTTVIADEDYLKESILRPANKVVAGYPPRSMPPYLGMEEAELLSLIAFIKSLSQ